jgi:hypothetical protein
MKAISLWQPWASLLFTTPRAKLHETRHWPTSYRGLLYIHAAKRPMRARDVPMPIKDYFQRPTADEDRRLLRAEACPFCGSFYLEFGRMAHYVHCRKCGADGPEIVIRRAQSTDERAQLAVEAWNRRVSIAAVRTKSMLLGPIAP